MTNLTLFLLALMSTMAVMNIYFHISLSKGGIIHKGKIFDADNNSDGLVLKIMLKNEKVVIVKCGKKIEDKKFYKFIEKNLGNTYDVVEIDKNGEKEYIHNGSYLIKGILFTLGSIALLGIIIFNNQ